MLKQFGALIAWLSGSVAGISAILYALGFIATKSADQVLGVGLDFASRDPFDYVARGGSVVMRTVIISMGPVLVVMALASLFRRGYARSGLGKRQSLDMVRRWGGVAAAPTTALTMIVLVFAGLTYCVLPALQVEGLLFAEAKPLDGCNDGGDIAAAILSQDRAVLGYWFNLFAVCIGLVTGLGIIARSRLALEGQRIWLTFAGVAGLLALVGVPIAYGALVVQASAPDVWINASPNDGASTTRMLSRSDSGVLVWLEDKRKVQWINVSRIDNLTIGRDRPILTVSCSWPHLPTDGD